MNIATEKVPLRPNEMGLDDALRNLKTLHSKSTNEWIWIGVSPTRHGITKIMYIVRDILFYCGLTLIGITDMLQDCVTGNGVITLIPNMMQPWWLLVN